MEKDKELTKEQITEIRESKLTLGELSQKFGLSIATLWRVRTGVGKYHDKGSSPNPEFSVSDFIYLRKLGWSFDRIYSSLSRVAEVPSSSTIRRKVAQALAEQMGFDDYKEREDDDEEV